MPFDVSATDAQYAHLIYGYSLGLGTEVMLMSGLFMRAEWEYVRFTSQGGEVSVGRYVDL